MNQDSQKRLLARSIIRSKAENRTHETVNVGRLVQAAEPCMDRRDTNTNADPKISGTVDSLRLGQGQLRQLICSGARDSTKRLPSRL